METSSLQGKLGSTGEQGPQGEQGASGPAGAKGMPGDDGAIGDDVSGIDNTERKWLNQGQNRQLFFLHCSINSCQFLRVKGENKYIFERKYTFWFVTCLSNYLEVNTSLDMNAARE